MCSSDLLTPLKRKASIHEEEEEEEELEDEAEMREGPSLLGEESDEAEEKSVLDFLERS